MIVHSSELNISPNFGFSGTGGTANSGFSSAFGAFPRLERREIGILMMKRAIGKTLKSKDEAGGELKVVVQDPRAAPQKV